MKWTRGETHTNANEIRHVWLQVIEGAVVLPFEFVHLLEEDLPPLLEKTCKPKSPHLHRGLQKARAVAKRLACVLPRGAVMGESAGQRST